MGGIPKLVTTCAQSNQQTLCRERCLGLIDGSVLGDKFPRWKKESGLWAAGEMSETENKLVLSVDGINSALNQVCGRVRTVSLFPSLLLDIV